ncbi:hypothetical protein GOP80_06700 [Planococcaceae bacterium Storch 2/2-2]|nr:hypothetical protein [Planococcaceae bacterium Storch 2/2-2]
MQTNEREWWESVLPISEESEEYVECYECGGMGDERYYDSTVGGLLCEPCYLKELEDEGVL